MSKIDYELKAELIDSLFYKDYKKINRVIYHYCNNNINSNDISIETAFQLYDYMYSNHPKEWKECERINHAHFKRVKRLKDRVTIMITNGDCIFLTLTFTDESLQKTQESYRRKAVQRFLNKLNCSYIANKDFGKKKGREHYHALVQIDFVNYSMWKLGAINGQKIRNNTDDVKRIAKYIAKLTNHAIKATTKRSVIMYSREKKHDL